MTIKNFLKKLHNKFKPKLLYNPTGLIIDTTMLCNNNCSFCWRNNKKDYLRDCNQKYEIKTMSFDIYKKIIDDACRYESIYLFTLCGPMGEPLLNDNIEKFYEYAYNKKHFKWIWINSNGLILDKKNISILLNTMNEFSFSVDSIDPDTYKKIHGHDKLDKVINNIKKCVDYKKENGCLAKIVVRFTENKLNKGQLDDFAAFFKDLGVNEINYALEHSFIDVNTSISNISDAGACRQAFEIVNFNFLGDLTTCCANWHLDPTFGNIRNKNIKQLWESKNKLLWNNNRLEQSICKNCSGIGEFLNGEKRYRRIVFK